MFHLKISEQKVYFQSDANIKYPTNFLITIFVKRINFKKRQNLKRNNTLEFVQELYTINPWKSTLLTHNTFAKRT